jgi:hypothetical protein
MYPTACCCFPRSQFRMGVFIVTLLTLAAVNSFAADRSPTQLSAKFIGGTESALSTNTSGKLNLSDAQALLYKQDTGNSPTDTLRIDFKEINLLEYGQKVDRRIAAAVLISPLFLLSKSRKHFLTIGYRDSSDQQQALIFSVKNDRIRVLLAALEAKTGIPVKYLDVEARKSMGGL